MSATDTEFRLANWRDGSTNAERLAAAVLRLEGFQSIEPQAPLGGRDGRKDLLCDRGGMRWLGAVYFPTSGKEFADIQDKFRHDLEGVQRNARQGIVFVTNQRLTIANRESLVDTALQEGAECIIFDVERIRSVLDSPSGYGVRIAYLRIEMSLEEQLAFFARRDSDIAEVMDRNTAELRRLAGQIAKLQAATRYTAETVRVVAGRVGLEVGLPSPRTVDPLPMGDLLRESLVPSVSKLLSPELIMLVHRLVGFELPPRWIGVYRSSAVQLGSFDGLIQSSVEPPPPGEVPRLVSNLCESWCQNYSALTSEQMKLHAIADFHHRFLVIHPFVDGNGRVARALVLQQCVDLFGRADMSRLDRGAEYNSTLLAANEGRLAPLEQLFRPVVDG